MQSKKLTNVAPLKSSMKSLEDNVAFYEASAEELKPGLAAAIKDSSWRSQLVDDISVELVDLRERLSAKDGVIVSIVDNLCASLGPSLRGLLEIFCVGLDKSVIEAFRASSIGSQFNGDAVNDGITLCFSKGAASEDGEGSINSEDVIEPPADPKVIEF